MSTSGEGAELKEKQNESTTTLLPRLEALEETTSWKETVNHYKNQADKTYHS